MCSALTSCNQCIAKAIIGIDTGERCVWCPDTDECKSYQRHSFQFPCANAMRAGGGFPGGDNCFSPVRARAQPSSAAATRWGPPFTYQPVTTAPVNVIIPSFARPSNLPFALAWLLQLEPMHRPGSQVLVSHGSTRSLASSNAIDANTSQLCQQASNRTCALQTVRHLDAVSMNEDVYAAHRYHAAASELVALPAPDVLIHVDDDLVPSEAMLQVSIPVHTSCCAPANHCSPTAYAFDPRTARRSLMPSPSNRDFPRIELANRALAFMVRAAWAGAVE